jgi:hypothetical protein
VTSEAAAGEMALIFPSTVLTVLTIIANNCHLIVAKVLQDASGSVQRTEVIKNPFYEYAA